MAYLGNGIYDLIDVIKASKNPQINYEGLYQDPMPNVLTYNPLKAMTPGYSFNTLYPSYLEDNPDMFSPGGKFYDDLKLRSDFKTVNQGLPLYSGGRYADSDRVGRFEGFNPRVGIINSLDLNKFANTVAPMGVMTQAPDFERFEGITKETDIDDDTQDTVNNIVRRVEDDDLEASAIPEFAEGELKQSPTGIARLFEFLSNLPTPFNLVRRGLESLSGVNQRLRNTDFGQSKTLMEYFGKKQARREAERLAPIQKQLQEAAERGGGFQETNQKQNIARTASRVSDGKRRAYGL